MISHVKNCHTPFYNGEEVALAEANGQEALLERGRQEARLEFMEEISVLHQYVRSIPEVCTTDHIPLPVPNLENIRN